MDKPDILVKGLPSTYEVEHLIRLFYPAMPLRKSGGTRGALVYARAGKGRLVAALREDNGTVLVRTRHWEGAANGQTIAETKLALCRLVYDLLRNHTGLRPPWGMLTGVRPVSLLRKREAELGEAGAKQALLQGYDVSEEKYQLAKGVAELQRPVLAQSRDNSYSLYLSIPFCPTRCAYCSFVSRTIGREGHLIPAYLQKLEQELALTAVTAAECGLRLESIYIGGGTPTALDLDGLRFVLQSVQRHFDTSAVREYTVEAGRPDCTDYAKLALLKEYGVTRISINPQTMDDRVLQNIGRSHSAEDVRRCFADARRAGNSNINADLIAGLPGDDAATFAKSLAEVLALSPESITVHTLTLKRASNLVIEGGTGVSPPEEMLQAAYPVLAGAGYQPYYLYRQKSGVANLENTGWAKPGMQGLYNIYIMEETHTILAVGAGASTKLVGDGGKAIQRLYNHKLPLEYIERFAELAHRKTGVRDFYARYLDTQTTG